MAATPSVSAAANPVELVVETKTATAVEGSADGTERPAAAIFVLSRKLKSTERIEVPFRVSADNPSQILVALNGSPRGVTLDGDKLVFVKGARKASLMLTTRGDVGFDSFRLTVPSAVVTSSADRGRSDAVWTSRAVVKRGGLSGNGADLTFKVKHLPRASVTAKAAQVDEGGTAAFQISLDRPWTGPGRKAEIWYMVEGSPLGGADALKAGQFRRLQMPKGSQSKTLQIETRDDAVHGPDTTMTLTLLLAAGYWTRAATREATVTVRDNDPAGAGEQQQEQPDPPEDPQVQQPAEQQQDPPEDPQVQDDENDGTPGDTDTTDTDTTDTDTSDTDTTDTDTSDTDTSDSTDSTDAEDPPSPPTPAAATLTVSGPAAGDGWVYPIEGLSEPAASAFNYCVTLSQAPTSDVTVTPTATPAKLVSIAALTFTPADWDRACFAVRAHADADDKIDSPPPKITVSHAVSSKDPAYSAAVAADYVLWMLDNDPTTVTLSATDATASEGDAKATAELKLSLGRALQPDAHVHVAVSKGKPAAYGESISVPLSFEGGELGVDFSLTLVGKPTGVTLDGNRVKFVGTKGGSATDATLRVTALADSDSISEEVTATIPADATNRPGLEKSDKWVHLGHGTSNNGGAKTVSKASFTITDSAADATPPTPPAALPTVEFAAIIGKHTREGWGASSVIVRISETQAHDVTVNLSQTGSAKHGSDYTIPGATATTATVTIPKGKTSATLPVTIVDDDVYEYEREDVRLELAPGTGYTYERSFSHRYVHTFDIWDNDEPKTRKVHVWFFPYYVWEGWTAYLSVALRTDEFLPVKADKAVTFPVTVTRGTAEAGDIFRYPTSATVPAGKSYVMIEVETTADLDRDDETFTVAIGSPLPEGYTRGNSSTVTIKDRTP
ncbi:MAG: hypothetical protein OXF61_05320 [Acidimicrobiaceae bacterium]|nr:hypothetical protein [Acidimicrobiaceae bacterium]